MNFKIYFKGALWKILYVILSLLIIDTILFTSTTISKSISDIIYMNILLLALALTYFIFGYYRWNHHYKDYKKALDAKEGLQYNLLNGDHFEAQLLKETFIYKDKELYEETRMLQDLLEEFHHYITQWVHEIKIPLSVCELIGDKLSDTMENEALGTIPQDMALQLERIKFLVDQVLYASRASNYSEDVSIEEVNLERIIKEAIKKNASFFISKNISIHLNYLNYSVMTDRKWLSYIVQQLLHNAYKYLGNNGHIEVSGIEDDKSIKLTIRDTGIGIQKKDIRRIFDKGFTGENGRRTSKSTGMGLYYSKKMLDKLGHNITVSSKVNNFTEFTITFYKLSDYINVAKL